MQGSIHSFLGFEIMIRGTALLIAFAVIALPASVASSDSEASFTSSADSSDALASLVSVLLAAGPPEEYAYRGYSEIKGIIYDVVSNYPEICEVHDIGDSWEKTQGLADRDILAVKISDNVADDEEEPEMLIMALQHAREWPTSEVAVELILALTEGYGMDARTSWLVDNRELWIVPVVNPDGLDFALSIDDDWRKNRRDNLDGTYGVDLNRNYDGSQNGDPLGEWGGAGASYLTYASTYCGEYPFSEPETQAIRDLALGRDFKLAFDFHTHGDLVCWPWGYTTDPAPDNEILIELGTLIAAANGYTPEQSSEMYLTTGDSLDWLYGGQDIFTFLFEMGDEFHPRLHEEVVGIINDNIAASYVGLELSGDRYLKAFSIDHDPVRDVTSDDGDCTFVADVSAERGVDESSVALAYRVDYGSWETVAMTPDPSDTSRYECEVLSLPLGGYVEYYLSAKDLGGVSLSEPRYAPYEVHSFVVGAISDPPVADAGTDQEALVGTTVSFSGEGSYDDVGIESYVWTFDCDGPVILQGVTPKFLFDDLGTYTITLTVQDADGQSDSDTMEVTVYDDVMPIAHAGDDWIVGPGDTVILSGTESSDNDEIVSYTWDFVYDDKPMVLEGETVSFTFDIEGAYTVTLTVIDAAGNEDSDSVLVTVTSEVIPEFSGVIIAFAAMVAIFVVIRARRS